MTRDLAGSPIWAAGIHSRAPISACPAFPHVRQVHSVDPVGHLAHAAQVLPLHPGRAGAGLDLPGFVERADRQAAPPPGPAGGLIQSGHGEPAHHSHRREGVPHRAAEQPLGLVRGAVSGLRGDRPAVPLGDLAHHRGGVLARLQPSLCPREARPQQVQQLSAFPPRQRGAYPGGSSRRRTCCPHKHMIGRRLRPRDRVARPVRAHQGRGDLLADPEAHIIEQHAAVRENACRGPG